LIFTKISQNNANNEKTMSEIDARLRQMLDKDEILQVMLRYARGVDRGDMELIRQCYHPDAYDDHVEFKGNVEDLITWLADRFKDVDNSTHLIGNCLVEFKDVDTALVETYYNSRRIRPATAKEIERDGLQPHEEVCRQSWGRYIDRFERRQGEWRVAHRVVVLESRFTMTVRDSERDLASTWGLRSLDDPLYSQRSQM
jgi:hypothetical protein